MDAVRGKTIPGTGTESVMSSHIVMLLTNPFRPDPRVLKEGRTLVQAGYRVTVLAWDRKGELPDQETIEGIEIRRIRVTSGYSVGSRQILYLPQYWRLAIHEMKSLQPDVIHCHDLDTTPAGYWYAQRHRIPWIYDAHECYPEQIGPQVSPMIYRLLLWLEKRMVPRATHLITVGHKLGQRFAAQGAKAVTVVGNYQPLTGYQPIGITRETLGIAATEKIWVYVGGFTLARAIIPAIQATAQLPGWTFVLAGDGPQKAAVEAILPDYPNVRYVGWIAAADVPDYMRLADVIYYGLNVADGNSQYSAPNALFMALALGKPLVTTHVGEIGAIVAQEKCGQIIEKAEPELIAAAIRRFEDTQIQQTMAEQAKKAGKETYHWDAAANALRAVYRSIGL